MGVLLSLLIDVPPTVRARPDFCGAVGRAVEVHASVDRNEIVRGNSLRLTVILAGVDNPKEVKRPSLEAWQSKAQIEPDGETIESDSVSFHYHLRPRGVATGWPRLKIESFHPGAAEGKQVRTMYLEMPRFAIWEGEKGQIKTIPMPFQIQGDRFASPLSVWAWLGVIPVSLLTIPVLNRLRTWLAQQRDEARREKAREQLNDAWNAPDPVAAAIEVLQKAGLNPSPLIPPGERIRFAPNSPSAAAFFADARRMLSP